MGKKGYKHTEEHNRKISLSHFGIRPSKETRKKMSIAKKGKPSWNKGKKLSKIHCKNLCLSHLGKMMGKKHPNWKGGKYMTRAGYVVVLNPKHPFADIKGYIFEHRIIVEKQIGRYLKPKEKCHHLEKKDNNNPKMLMAFINNSAHIRFHKNPDNVKPKEIIFDGRL